ncbi:hypothetical protein [Streptomyces sp. YGL11-2]|uniref:hypothetical protein n=1 Tax=Streptomyces sp. YGL11-2 TaxID=3414028 RepID=UPI003CF12779
MTSTTITAPYAADTTAADDNPAEAAEAAILSEFDLYLLAKPLADALGDDWREDTDENPGGADKLIRLVHPDGRAIGIRHLWQGEAVQTFAVGGPAPKPSAGTDSAPAANPNRLAKGVRYSTGVFFTTAEPLEEILAAIRTVLLPAFDGHRPRLRANGTRITPAEPTVDKPAEATPQQEQSDTDQPTTTAGKKAKTTAAKRRSTTPSKRKTKTSAKQRRTSPTAA